jgi:pimeloyl-ACP methyl ester carboxylesterase
LITPFFHAWERRLATVDRNRVVRPFEWGLDWLGLEQTDQEPSRQIIAWSDAAVATSEQFYETPKTGDYTRRGNELTFPSALTTPYPENDLVRALIFDPEPARSRKPRPRRGVIVIPQWNADEGGHIGLCQLFAKFGITALRLSLPYHHARRPAELQRADFIVSSNIGRTLQANRQAVMDIRRSVDWFEREGFERIGIVGTSLGSCLSMLAMTHDTRIRAGAFNHVSPYFADVVWRGLSTRHVREGLEGHIALDRLRQCWMPISPWPFIDRVRDRRTLLIYARYDLTFPVDLSKQFIQEFRRRNVPYTLGVLPCGHYTTGKPPFSYLDGYYLTKFLVKNL